MTDPSADTASTLTPTAAAQIARRTVLAGSAFAVPAIMMVASTPAFAASGLTLAFDQSSYSGQGCSTISGAKVSASEGGNPKAGVAITVSLSNGYTFADGGTTTTGVTGSGGFLTLPDIKVPASGSSATASATSAGATSASASLSGTAASRFLYIQNGNDKAAIGVPSGSTPAYSAGFLAPDGQLINGSTGGLIASNVDSVGQIFSAPDGSFWAVPLKKKDGTFTYIDNGTEKTAIGVPSGSTPAYSAGFLAPDGQLINGSTGGLIASNVDSVGQIFSAPDGSFWAVPLKKKDGTFTYIDNGTEKTAIGVPSGSTPAYSAGFLAPDGQLINGSTGGLIASNVDSVGQIFSAPDGSFWAVPLEKKDGTFTYIDNGTEKTAIGVPSGSTPAYSAGFLAPDGQLINGSTGGLIASNVDSVGQIFSAPDGSFWAVPLKQSPTSC